VPSMAAWSLEGRQQMQVLHKIFSCAHPKGDCMASLHSLQHAPLDARATLLRGGSQAGCIHERVQRDLQLEVSVDVRCLPGLPPNTTCFSISETYPRALEWPHGYGLFDPFHECTGIDQDLLSAVCTLRCAVTRGARHAELFCAYELDRHGKYGLRERHVHPDFCDISSTCVSASLEESELTCYAAATLPGGSLRSALLLSALDERMLVPTGLAAAVLAAARWCRRRLMA